MIASASTFAALFRHSLIALGEPAPDSRRGALDQLGEQGSGFDSAAFHAVLDLREGKRAAGRDRSRADLCRVSRRGRRA